MKKPNLDTVTTINKDGSKYNIHPADVKGSFTLRRRLTAWVLILIYILLPWIKINGYPAVFLDLDKRQFHFMGLTLFTQDFWVLFFFISGLAFTLFVLSSIVGRVWCGWFCPYTVFLEHLYRRIERFVDGDAPKRRRLDEAPMNKTKFFKRAIKWSFYVLVSFILAHVFLSYFISIPGVWSNITDGPAEHITEFLFILAFTGIFTFCFGWFREQFCIILCPYGRFQSALTDDQTVTVFYDYNRGEPRGKMSKNTDKKLGDCIDCRRCVNVCPTGIDIRNGLQLECVACSACVDACNEIMTKVNRPKGLIRYDSSAGISTGKRKILRPRLFLYMIFTAIGLGVLGAVFVSKAKPFHAGITRVMGTTYTANEQGVRNQYQIKLTNKRNQDITYTYKLINSPGFELSAGTNTITLGPLQKDTVTFTVFSPVDQYKGSADIFIDVTSEDGTQSELTARFLGPAATLYKDSLNEKQESTNPE